MNDNWKEVCLAYNEAKEQIVGKGDFSGLVVAGLKAAFAKAEELGMVTMVSPEKTPAQIQAEKERELTKGISATLARDLETDEYGSYICFDFEWAADDLRSNYPWFEEAFVRAAAGESSPPKVPIPEGWRLSAINDRYPYDLPGHKRYFARYVRMNDSRSVFGEGDSPDEAVANAYQALDSLPD